MFRTLFTAAVILASSLALAQEPVPVPMPVPMPILTPATLVVSERVTGDGTRELPFSFTIGMKGDIRLANGGPGEVTWVTTNAPAETEILDNTKRILFPTEIPGLYVVSPSWVEGTKSAGLMCWFEIKGANGPPNPPDTAKRLSSQVKAAFVGPNAKTDAKLYMSALDAVIDAMSDPTKSAKIITIFDIQTAYKTSLDSVGWKAGSYPKLSVLAGDLFGAAGTPDKPLDDSLRASYLDNFKALSKACLDISK